MPNHLINETSPYLLQHAHNPVEWYAWGEEALEKAKSENKPIFLSIGYAACHWCHVMEKESFENKATADIMNEHFVNIKVDREERPDLDQIYMSAVIAMTGHGGWPMSVWLTPDGVPFYGGTYFPPTDRQGMPGFGRLLQSLVDFYHRQTESMQKQGAQILSRMDNGFSLKSKHSPLDPALTEKAAQAILRNIDREHGGSRGAPKFPQPMIYDFLLRWHSITQNPDLLDAVELTLQKMARGGIYDQLGGGFHRYSTDAEWLAPHFEKMLYDNALLARLYLHAYQATGNIDYRQIVEETLDYVAREMTHPTGGFFATQDADSEGVEGKFFVWTSAEVLYILGDKAAKNFEKAFDVSRKGNWEGKNILRQKQPLADVAAELNIPLDDFLAELADSRKQLFEHREKRAKPARDEKILTAWNGLMLAAFAEAGRVFKRKDYLDIARKNAQFVRANLRTAEGRLLRTWKDGRAKLNGYLEDYAFLADGLLTLYQSTFDETYFMEARNLMDTVLAHFSDTENGGFFDTADDHPKLVVRPKDVQDNAIPSGNAMAIRNLLHLAAYTGDEKYYQPAIAALSAIQDVAGQYPSGFSHWLGALVFAQVPVKEIALIGKKDSPEMQALLQIAQQNYRPHQIIALSATETETSAIPLLNHRPALKGQATAYVCQNFSCQLPVNSPDDLEKQLSA